MTGRLRLLALLVWAALLGPGCIPFDPEPPVVVVRGPCPGPLALHLPRGNRDVQNLSPGDCVELHRVSEAEGAWTYCAATNLASEEIRAYESGDPLCTRLVKR